MDDAALVRCDQGVGDLMHDAHRTLGLDRTALDELGQRAAGEQLHDDVDDLAARRRAHAEVEDEHTKVVQLARAKDLVGEILVFSTEIAYVQAEPAESDGEW